MFRQDSRLYKPVCGVQEELSDPMAAMSGEVIKRRGEERRGEERREEATGKERNT
jgi:hypothetical protein